MKGVIIGCSVIGLILTIVGGVGIWYFLFRVQPLADATLSVPSSAEIDQPIEMVVTTSNPHAESVIVDSIDISDSFLKGFQVTAIDPSANETVDVPFIDQRAWMFAHTLAPGETKTFTFTLNPVLVGHYSGDVDVCNPNQDFNTLLADVVIRVDTAGASAGEGGSDKSEPAAPSSDKIPSEAVPEPDSESPPESGSNAPKRP